MQTSCMFSEIFDAQKLKNLIDENPAMSVEDKQRLKIAFAEGYLAGHNIKPPGTKSVSFFFFLLLDYFFLCVF